MSDTTKHEVGKDKGEFINRRRILEWLAVLAGGNLLNGFIGEIPWRVIDFLTSRRNAPAPMKHRVAAERVQHSWRTRVSSVTLNKRAVIF